jgi:hypothetical protein
MTDRVLFTTSNVQRHLKVRVPGRVPAGFWLRLYRNPPRRCPRLAFLTREVWKDAGHWQTTILPRSPTAESLSSRGGFPSEPRVHIFLKLVTPHMCPERSASGARGRIVGYPGPNCDTVLNGVAKKKGLFGQYERRSCVVIPPLLLNLDVHVVPIRQLLGERLDLRATVCV